VTKRVKASGQAGGRATGERFAGVYEGKRIFGRKEAGSRLHDLEDRAMPRLTDLNDVLFPVNAHPVFVSIKGH